MKKKVAIIIPFKRLDDNVRKCIKEILNMDYKDYDILLLPDERIMEKFPKTRVIPTGPVVPAIKRNKVIFKEDYEFFASIDSDAYPDKYWLSNTIKIFKDKNICAVGGPNLAPKDSSILEKAAIDIVYSYLGVSTAYFNRKYKKNLYEVKELASSNLINRKEDFIKTKGYNTGRLTGEDSIACFNLRKITGKKIIYSPNVIVYHHRRRLFWPHLQRVFVQGSDKGAIMLNITNDFKNMVYFIPLAFVLFLITGTISSFFSVLAFKVFISILIFYFILAFLDSLRTKNIPRMFLVILGLPLTHISYGLGYVHGMFFNKKTK